MRGVSQETLSAAWVGQSQGRLNTYVPALPFDNYPPIRWYSFYLIKQISLSKPSRGSNSQPSGLRRVAQLVPRHSTIVTDQPPFKQLLMNQVSITNDHFPLVCLDPLLQQPSGFIWMFYIHFCDSL